MSTCRNDEYGGSLENRVRLLEDTREAVGDTCAVAFFGRPDGRAGLAVEGRGVFELVGELPDLWDLKTFGVQDSSALLRVGPDPLHPEPHHRRGVAAGLASRADRGASFQRRRARGRSGPAGLEAARALGQRGYEVTLAEATELGGRLCHESRLPGLATWIRVRDWRRSSTSFPTCLLRQPASPEHVLEFGFPRVVVATGARSALCDARSVPATFGGRVLTRTTSWRAPRSSRRWWCSSTSMGGCLSELLARTPRYLCHPCRPGVGVVRQHP